jgi:hypothetical protein
MVRARWTSLLVSASFPLPVAASGTGKGSDTFACSATAVGVGVDGAAFACHEATPNAVTAEAVATPRPQLHFR